MVLFLPEINCSGDKVCTPISCAHICAPFPTRKLIYRRNISICPVTANQISIEFSYSPRWNSTV